MTTNSASYKIWTERKLGSLFSFHRSLSASRAQLGDIGIPYLHYGDIHKTGKTNFDPEKDELPKLDYRENAERYLLKNGDIVFVDASEDRKDVSRFCVIKNKNDIPFLAGLHTVVARPTSSELNINFSEFLFQSDDFKRQVSILANGMKVFGVSKDILSNIVIHYPENTTEQEKIAEILGTWDLAIEKLTALIEQKKLLKKGLMQRLLTGKQRLPGFSTPWNKVKLKNICDISKGEQLGRLEMTETGVYPVINGGISKSGLTDSYNREKDTITISEGGNSCGFVAFMKERFWCGGHCYALSNLQTNLHFLFQILKSKESDIMKLRVGSGLPNIQKSSLDAFSLHIPTDISEQKAIADILSKADEEIDLLTRKLDLLQSQKKGLMQQLLTGKIRVKVA